MGIFSRMFVFAVAVGTASFAVPQVWTGDVAKKFDGGTGKKGDPFLISTAEQFAKMASTTDTAGTYFKLTEDILLNEGDASEWSENPPANQWTVYGTLETPVYLYLDGNSHKVSGLYVNSSDSLQGLFGVFKGYVSDLHLVNGYVKGGDATGSIAGMFYCSTGSGFSDPECGLYRDSVSIRVEGNNVVGGIVGGVYHYYPKVERRYGTTGHSVNLLDIVFSGSVVGKNVVGGLLGVEVDSYSNVRFENSVNLGSVMGEKVVGGMIGRRYMDVPFGSIVRNLKNYGSVKGDSIVGGIIGEIESHRHANDEPLINSAGLMNFGDVNGNSYVGGILGLLYNSYRKIVYFRINHSYNAGTVSGIDSVGAILGGYDMDPDTTFDTLAYKCLNFGKVVKDGETVLEQKTVSEANAMLTPLTYEFVADNSGKNENLGYPLFIPSNLNAVISKGSGTEDDPYLISDEWDLLGFETLFWLHSDDGRMDTLYFRQTDDIAWTGKYGEWFIDTLCRVNYNGGGHTISGIKINRPDQDSVGFVRFLKYTDIYHLTLKDFEVVGRNSVGLLAGATTNGSLHHMRFYGTVKGDSVVGGMIGRGGQTVSNVLSYVDVSGKTQVGGMYGYCYPTLSYSASLGKVVGDSLVGGVCGEASNNYSGFDQVYAVNDVEARVHGSIFAYNTEKKAPNKTNKIYYKKSEYKDYDWGTALDDKFMRSDAFLDSLPVTFMKDTAKNSPGYPIPAIFDGFGTSKEPYLIKNANDMNLFGVLASHRSLTLRHYKLAADIDMKRNRDYPWTPISSFLGYLDGDYHVINNMKVVNDTGRAAIFASFYGSVKNMGVRSSSFTGAYAAPFAADFEGQMEKCWNENTSVQGYAYAGGLVTRMTLIVNTTKGHYGAPKIDRVYNTGSITSKSGHAGALVAYITTDSYSQFDSTQIIVSNAYNRGSVMSQDKENGFFGRVELRDIRNFKLLSNAYDTNDKPCSDASVSPYANMENYYRVYSQECADKTNTNYYNLNLVKTAKDMKTEEFVKTLGDAFTMDKDKVNDGFPILKDLKPRTDYKDDPDDDTLDVHLEMAKIARQPVLRVAAAGRLLEISGLVPGSELRIYDVTGMLLRSLQVTGENIALPVNRSGMFIIRNGGNVRAVRVK